MKMNQSFMYGMGSGLILASILFGASDLLQAGSRTQGNEPAQTVSKPNAEQQQAPPAAPDKGQAAPPQPNAPSTQAAQPQAGSQAQEPVKVKFDIREGMNARQIADMLVQKGIISDADSFLNAAGSRVSSIRIGSYELPLKADHEQVLSVITKG